MNARTIGTVAVVAMLLGAVIFAAWPRGDNPVDATRTASQEQFDPLAAPQTDSDGDGLSDAAENFQWGTDPGRASTTGNGISDGWFIKYGYDATRIGVESLPAAIPHDNLPAIYGAIWPASYGWNLRDAHDAGGNIDPRIALAPSGLPAAWLHFHGLPISDPAVAQRVMVSGGLTVGEAFEHDTNPHRIDSDGDGLTDRAEIRTYQTDPRRFSTGGSGIPDGWFVQVGLDPLDSDVATMQLPGKGMTAREVYDYNVASLGVQEARRGNGLDPLLISSRGDGIPDGWLTAYGLDALDDDIGLRIIPFDEEIVAAVHAAQPVGAPRIEPLTVRQAYEHGRPADWLERLDGPWWGGFDPADGDADDDGLPDALEITGWLMRRDLGLGPQSEPETILVRSHPLRADSDGDGVLDAEEALGAATRDDLDWTWPPTDPGNQDTAFQGLSDGEAIFDGLYEVGADGALTPLLNPARRDTDQDHLADGTETIFWTQRAAQSTDPYLLSYPGSAWESTQAWLVDMPGGPEPTALLPDGDLDGDDALNILDNDADGDGLLDGWERDPRLLPALSFSSGPVRSATDPANPDTDGDGLLDAWEATHARAVAGTWDLDPSQWASDGGDVGDGDRNLDNDVVQWYAYRSAPGATMQVESRPDFEFTNRLEADAGTDPHLKDTNLDGVSDGWSHFWSTEYAGLVVQALIGQDAAAMAQLGEVHPTSEQVADKRTELGPPSAPVGTRVKSFHLSSVFLPAAQAEQLAAGQTMQPGYPRDVEVVRDAGALSVRLAKVQINSTVLHRDDATFGLNPYLADSDGDGLPDAWELAWRACTATTTSPASGGPDPLVPDAHADPDSDRLSNLDEFLAGSIPCRLDSDLGGIPDGQEAERGFDPMNPSDDLDAASASQDSDSDGLSDETEVFVTRTNPFSPDSDRDGLLDGDSILVAGSSDLVAEWQALGIAHRQTGNGNYEFYGEDPVGADPLDAHTASPQVPDGWLAYYGRSLTQGPIDAGTVAAYQCGQPAWWTADHGVWWWGQSNAGPCPVDSDHDGLPDGDGSDPVPAASQHNDGAGDFPLDEPLRGAALVRAAQSWGECAGDPTRCRAEWPAVDHDGDGIPDATDRVDATITVTSSLPSRVTKLTPWTITTLVDCEPSCGGLPSRAVVVEAALDGVWQPMGLGFTNDAGTSDVTVCLCAARSTPVPPQVTALGSFGQDATLADGLAAPVGDQIPWRVRALATPANLGDTPSSHPQYKPITRDAATYDASGGAITQLGTILIGSQPAIQLAASTIVPPGASQVELDGTVVDEAGRPVAGVLLRGAGAQDAISDEAGRFTTTIQAPNSGGTVQAEMRIAASSVLHAVSTSLSVHFQQPLALTLHVPATWSGSASVPVHLEAIAGTAAADGVTVTLRTGSWSMAGVTVDGAIAFDVPADALQLGSNLFQATTLSDERHPASKAESTLEYRQGARLSAFVPDVMLRGTSVVMQGQLTSGAAPLGDRQVIASLGDVDVAADRTNVEGRFEIVVPIAPSAVAGSTIVTLSFRGDGTTQETQFQVPSIIGVPTRLTIHQASLGAGQSNDVAATLTAEGTPLAGQPIAFRINGTEVTALTDEHGAANITHDISDELLGDDLDMAVLYAGSPNGTFAAARVDALVPVTAPATLHITDAVLRRGNQTIEATLSSNGAPLADAEITLRLADQVRQVRSNNAGVARAPFHLNDEYRPGDYRIDATFAGTKHAAPAHTDAMMPLRTPSQVRAIVPSEVGRGQTIALPIALLDDAGHFMAARAVTVEAFGVVHNVTTQATAYNVSIDVPANLPHGTHEVTIHWNGDHYLQPTQAIAVVAIKDAATLDMEVLEDDDGWYVQIRLLDGLSQPVAGEDVGIRVGTAGLALMATTDANGTATARIPLPGVGEHQITARFAGDPELAASSTSQAVTVAAPTPAQNWFWIWIIAAILATAGMATWLANRRPRATAIPEPNDAPPAWPPSHDPVVIGYRMIMAAAQRQGFAIEDRDTSRSILSHLGQRARIPAPDLARFAQFIEAHRFGGNRLPGSLREYQELVHRFVKHIDEAEDP
ncbi:MAG: hypothetical protein ACPHID_02430 [Thermoplasmatota archaeon]